MIFEMFLHPGWTPPVVNSTGHDFKRPTPVCVRSHSWSYQHEVRRASPRAQRCDCMQTQIWRSRKNFCWTEVSQDRRSLHHSEMEDVWDNQDSSKSRQSDWTEQPGEKGLKSWPWTQWSPEWLLGSEKWDSLEATVLQQLGPGHWSRSRESWSEAFN